MKSRGVTGAWWATIVLFLVHGLVVAAWLSRIPTVAAQLRLNNAELGLTLLGTAVGAVCSIPPAGWLITRFGGGRVSAISGILFCLAIVGPGLAVNAWTLAAALFCFGGLGAVMDVSMNAHGVEVEKRLAKPTMSRFHAMFSSGAMAGATLGGFAASRGVRPLAQFAIAGVAGCVCVAAIWPLLLPAAAHVSERREGRLQLRRLPPVLIAVSAIGFCILLSEGAMADWTAVYFRQVLRVDAGEAAIAYAVFSAAMALFRFVGDTITVRLGPWRTVLAGSLFAACGLAWALCMPSAGWAMPGIAATGIGLSVIIPLVFGSGGKVESVEPGAGIATVTGLGYIGFLVGPPTIGGLSQILTLRYALVLVVACCLTAAFLSRYMRSLPAIASGAAPGEL